MILGGPIFTKYKDPEEWTRAVRDAGYKAAFCPVSTDTDEATAKKYAATAAREGIVIAEVGVWNNPLDNDETVRKAALEACRRGLDLAERMNAVCCVNIAGSRGAQWDGPDAANYTDETFSLIVETCRGIIDAVKPKRTFYTLETMPWMVPDSPESYLRLIKAVNRKAFAVHLDPVNMITTPRCFYRNRAFLQECFSVLGPYIKSCHAKDVALKNTFVVHIDEVRPGLGGLDYPIYIRELAVLGDNVPLMLEHLADEQEYRLAREFILSVARKENIAV